MIFILLFFCVCDSIKIRIKPAPGTETNHQADEEKNINTGEKSITKNNCEKNKAKKKKRWTNNSLIERNNRLLNY